MLEPIRAIVEQYPLTGYSYLTIKPKYGYTISECISLILSFEDKRHDCGYVRVFHISQENTEWAYGIENDGHDKKEILVGIPKSSNTNGYIIPMI